MLLGFDGGDARQRLGVAPFSQGVTFSHFLSLQVVGLQVARAVPFTVESGRGLVTLTAFAG